MPRAGGKKMHPLWNRLLTRPGQQSAGSKGLGAVGSHGSESTRGKS